MMSVSATGKKQCVTCSKSGGIMICDGCQKSFCGKHSIEHRQELTNQLDGIMQEHDLLQQEFNQLSVDNSLLKQINKWEKESITKIQVAAEAARADLREIIEKSKQQLSKSCHDIASNLRSSREADDFSENDLDQWIKQLKELKLEIISPSLIKLIEDEQSKIRLITIQDNSFTTNEPPKTKRVSVLKTQTAYTMRERFSQVYGVGVKLEDDGMVARHLDQDWNYVHILGEGLYSKGRQTVRFKVEFEHGVYNTFLGCISYRMINDKINFSSLPSAGWFGCNQIYHHGKTILDGYDSSQFKTNDISSLTFDCDQQQIELCHEHQKKTYKLKIDTAKAPLPWRLLVVLCRPNDCIGILPND